MKDFIKLLVDKKTAIDPTMTAFEAMFLQRQGTPNPSFNMVSPNMPPAISRNWLTNSMDVTDKNAEPFRKSFEKLLAFMKQMYDAWHSRSSPAATTLPASPCIANWSFM